MFSVRAFYSNKDDEYQFFYASMLHKMYVKTEYNNFQISETFSFFTKGHRKHVKCSLFLEFIVNMAKKVETGPCHDESHYLRGTTGNQKLIPKHKH